MGLCNIIMEYLFGYNYCDGNCVEGLTQWCILIIIFWLCEMDFNNDY